MPRGDDHADGGAASTRAEQAHDEFLAQRLASLGMDPRQARIYVHLFANGPSRPSAVAAATGLGRTDAYRILQDMAARGLVALVGGRPARYSAVSLERLLELQSSVLESALRGLQQAGDELGRAFAQLAPAKPAEAPATPFRLVRGRLDAIRTACGLIEQARSEFHVLSTSAAFERVARASGLLGAASRRAGAGVTGRFLAPEPQVEALRAHLGDVRVETCTLTAQVQFLLVDGRSALMWLAIDPSASVSAEGDLCLWTEASGMVHALRVLFGQLDRAGA